LVFLKRSTNGPKEFRDNIWIYECTTNAHMNAPPLSSCFETICFSKKIVVVFVLFVVYYNKFERCKQAYSQSRYQKGQSNKKKTSKDHFGFLLHLLFHDYNGLMYDYNYNDVMLI
jgi:hypothetical protein